MRVEPYNTTHTLTRIHTHTRTYTRSHRAEAAVNLCVTVNPTHTHTGSSAHGSLARTGITIRSAFECASRISQRKPIAGVQSRVRRARGWAAHRSVYMTAVTVLVACTPFPNRI